MNHQVLSSCLLAVSFSIVTAQFFSGAVFIGVNYHEPDVIVVKL